MVDINNQLLKLDFDEAKDEIAKLIGYGYTDLILTFPILKDGDYDIDDMISKFNIFKLNFKEINLYLGNEVNYHYSIIHRLKNNDILTLNKSKYLLLKLPEQNPPQLKQLIKALDDYKIIISCVDEYKYFSIHDLIKLKDLGVLYLTNIKNVRKRKVKQLLKNNLIDFLVTYDDINYLNNKTRKKLDHNYHRQLMYNNYDDIIKINL